MRLLSILCAGAVFALGACKDPRPAADAAEASSQAAEPLTPFPCVHFADLQRHLPKALEGFKAIRDEGSSGRYGEVSISEAERVFANKDGAEISVRIVDTTLAGELGRAIKAAAEDAATRPQGDPTAPIKEISTVGFVRFDGSEDRAEANLLVADRFVVAVTTRGLEGTQQARKVAGSIDFAGLALLR